MDPKAESSDAENAKNLGNARKAAGDLEGAIACYRISLEAAPDYVPSLYNLGLVLHSMNRLEEAEGFFQRVLQISPRDVEAYVHLGAILQKRAQFPAAAAAYRSALLLKPDDPLLWMLLGIACREGASPFEAIRALRKCTELNADFAEGHYELALAYKRQSMTDEAVNSYRRALELDDRNSGAHADLADILQAEGRLDEAVDHYHHALRSSPDYAAAYSSLACALLRQNKLDDAADLFSKALNLRPDLADAHLNLGSLHSLRGARDLALRCYQTALELKPGDASIRECVLMEKQHLCDWSGLDSLIASQRGSLSQDSGGLISPFSLLSIPTTRAEQLQCARQFAGRQSLAVARDRERLAFRFERRSNARLRIGYLSADFHEHATAYLTAELFELHDRGRFDVYAYSYGPADNSAMRSRLRLGFDRFVDIRGLSHADAAAAIFSDRIDILIDLKGYTTHARTGIVALRPAPIQVSYIGYPGTMGAPFIDYLIADRFVIPPEHAADYSEKLVRVPGSYQVNDRKRVVGTTPSRRELGLPGEGFVFCCFNQTYKILPNTFSAWMRLLSAVQGSVLWLLESNPWAASNLRREAERRGVAPDRLRFAPLLPLSEHLGRMRAADLFLDTLPYNAHTISSDALWAGLPVLTCPGDTFVARVAGSQLTAMEMPELITRSSAEYEAMALSLASAPAVLAALREKLARHRATAALFDTPSFTRSLEEAFQRMWRRHVAGDTPQAIVI